MLVRDVMTKEVTWIAPDTTVEDAAKMMRDRDIGVLPIGAQEKLVGVITDRDIVVRCIAEGRAPGSTAVRSTMSDKVLYCFDDSEAKDTASNMAQNQVRRMPVVDADKRLVGIVSLGDVAVHASPQVGGEALAAIAR